MPYLSLSKDSLIKCGRQYREAIKPMAHLDYNIGGSEVLIGTRGHIREARGQGNSQPLRCSVIKVQGALVALAGSLPRFPLTFNWTRKVTSKVFRAISTNCWTEA